MKTVFVVLGILIILFIAFQVYTMMATHKLETQTYQVIRTEKEFEIRYYPAAVMAKISSGSSSYSDLGNLGFGKLAKYIFGGNNQKKQIAMTSPVHMELGDSISTMAFVMPAEFKKEDLPVPDDLDIQIHTVSPQYVAAIRFGGFASASRFNAEKNKLEKLLNEKGIPYYGNFRLLGYNPPYQLIGRRNEVVVSVNAEYFGQ
jgi:hypothetical protein